MSGRTASNVGGERRAAEPVIRVSDASWVASTWRRCELRQHAFSASFETIDGHTPHHDGHRLDHGCRNQAISNSS